MIRDFAGERRIASAEREGHRIVPRQVTGDVGVVIGDRSASTFVRSPELLAAMLDALDRLGCQVRLVQLREPNHAAEILAQYRFDGCVWYLPPAEHWHAVRSLIRAEVMPVVVPLLEHASYDAGMERWLYGYDYTVVGRDRAEYMIARGHRRIVYCANDDSPSFIGYAAALARHGIELDRRLVIARPEDIRRDLPPLLLPGEATAIISDGAQERLESVLAIVEEHPWNRTGALMIDHIGPGHAGLLNRYPGARIAAVCERQSAAIGQRAAEDLVASMRQGSPIPGFRCGPCIMPVEDRSVDEPVDHRAGAPARRRRGTRG